MTAHRNITLTCDRDGCREKYLGGIWANRAQVRSEARKLAGWSTYVDDDGTTRDLCRWHT